MLPLTQASRKWLSFPSGSVRFQVTIFSTAWTRHRLGLEPWFWLQGQNISTLLHSTVSSPWLCHFHLRAAEEGTNSTCCNFLSRWLKQSFYKAYQPNPAKMKSKNVTRVRTEACVYQDLHQEFLSTATCSNKPPINAAFTSFSYRPGQNSLRQAISSSNWVLIRH